MGDAKERLLHKVEEEVGGSEDKRREDDSPLVVDGTQPGDVEGGLHGTGDETDDTDNTDGEARDVAGGTGDAGGRINSVGVRTEDIDGEGLAEKPGDGNPAAETLQTRTTYNRVAAVRYALRHWNNPNPDYGNFDEVGVGGDCANFVSQCLRAGGWPMDYRESAMNKEWWYRRVGSDRFDADDNDWWSCSWTIADLNFRYMRANGGQGLNLLRNPRLARTLRLGDTIYYDWEGDGVLNHSAIVTGHNRRGQPLVTYRTLRPRRPVRNALWTLRFRGRAGNIVAVRLANRPVDYGVAPDFNRLQPCDRSRG